MSELAQEFDSNKIRTTWILSNLCLYDKRNPDNYMSDEEIEDHNKILHSKNARPRRRDMCSCDNCFYGRTKLAEELVKVLDTTI